MGSSQSNPKCPRVGGGHGLFPELLTDAAGGGAFSEAVHQPWPLDQLTWKDDASPSSRGRRNDKFSIRTSGSELMEDPPLRVLGPQPPAVTIQWPERGPWAAEGLWALRSDAASPFWFCVYRRGLGAQVLAASLPHRTVAESCQIQQQRRGRPAEFEFQISIILVEVCPKYCKGQTKKVIHVHLKFQFGGCPPSWPLCPRVGTSRIPAQVLSQQHSRRGGSVLAPRPLFRPFYEKTHQSRSSPAELMSMWTCAPAV